MKKEIQQLTVVNNKKLSTAYFLLELSAAKNLKNIFPGQFLQLEIPGNKDVYLRRPFSIHDVEDNKIKLLIKIVGRATKTLAEIKKGESLSAIFPLGKGFDLNYKGKALLIGGGCGIAPLLYLARNLKKKKISPVLLYGGRSKEEIVLIPEFKKHCDEVHVATEDGSKGYQGFVTGILRKLNMSDYAIIYTCGPLVMMKNIYRAIRESGVPLQVSLEEKMACGIGACLCCVTEAKDDKHVCVCKEGPVFNVGDLNW